MRGEGSDFAGALPGGELDGLYAFQAAGEVLKLLGRFFAYVGTAPGALEPGEPEPGGSGPPPSTLRFTRVTLDG